jgi:glycosyltransferase involved in cell wall biosynthesis
MTIMLVSGLPLEKPSSFSRQLILLEAALGKEGVSVNLTGPSLSDFDPALSTVDAALLLGYVDQFQLLEQRASGSFPLFLWAQFSRSPAKNSLSSFLPVPLTKQTVHYVQESGHEHIGPVIPHGIDTSKYRPLSRSERSAERAKWNLGDGFVIGTVGAHTRRKRLDLIVQTLSHLRRAGMEAELLIKTDRVRSRDGEDLEEIARNHDVLSHTRFITGELGEQVLCSIYGCMDVYLNLSEWEGFCIPIVEALACGIPVCCPPLQGPGEIVPYDELFIHDYRSFDDNGSRLCEADPARTARVIMHAAESSDMIEYMRSRGIDEAHTRYDIREVARQWIELFNNKTHYFPHR